MRKLFEKVRELVEQGNSLELVTIVAGYGSTPRGAGARMVVTADKTTYGTIGGGAVEYQAGLLAAELLKEKTSCIREYQLTKDQVAGLGMICGGHVVVYFQYVDAKDSHFQTLCGQILEACEQDENSWLVTDLTDEQNWHMELYTCLLYTSKPMWRQEPISMSSMAAGMWHRQRRPRRLTARFRMPMRPFVRRISR